MNAERNPGILTPDEGDLTADLIRLYLVKAASYPLLNFDQEQILFARYRECESLEQLRADTQFWQTVKPEDKEDFCQALTTCKTIEHLLTCCNLRLVVPVAQKHLYQGLTFLDLIQEGATGLIKAVEKFDPTTERPDHTGRVRFSTYATYGIDFAIRETLRNTSSTIRLPHNVQDDVRKMRRLSSIFEVNGRPPTKEDLIAEFRQDTGLSKKRATTAYEVYQGRARVVSLDRRVFCDDDEGKTLADFIPADGIGPEEEVIQALEREGLEKDIAEALKSLTEREREVLFHVFYGSALTFYLSRQRLNQIKKGALEKLRNNPRLRKRNDTH